MDRTPPRKNALTDDEDNQLIRRSILRAPNEHQLKNNRRSVSFSCIKEVRYVDKAQNAQATPEETHQMKLTPISESASPSLHEDESSTAHLRKRESLSVMPHDLKVAPLPRFGREDDGAATTYSGLKSGVMASNGGTPVFSDSSSLFAEGLKVSRSPVPKLGRPGGLSPSPARPKLNKNKRSVMSIAGGPSAPLSAQFRPSLLRANADLAYDPDLDDDSSSQSQDPTPDWMGRPPLLPAAVGPPPSLMNPSPNLMSPPTANSVLGISVSDFLPPEIPSGRNTPGSPETSLPHPPTPPANRHRKRSQTWAAKSPAPGPPSVDGKKRRFGGEADDADDLTPTRRQKKKADKVTARLSETPTNSQKQHEKKGAAPPQHEDDQVAFRGLESPDYSKPIPPIPARSPRQRSQVETEPQVSCQVGGMVDDGPRVEVESSQSPPTLMGAEQQENVAPGEDTPRNQRKKRDADNAVVRPPRVPPKVRAKEFILTPKQAEKPRSPPEQWVPNSAFRRPPDDDRAGIFELLGLGAILHDCKRACQELTELAVQDPQPPQPWTVSLRSLLDPDTKMLQEFATQLGYNMASEVVEERAMSFLETYLSQVASKDYAGLIIQLKGILAQATLRSRLEMDNALEQVRDAFRIKADIAEAHCAAMWQKVFARQITVNTITLTHSFIREIKEKLGRDSVMLEAKRLELHQLNEALLKSMEQRRSKEQLLELWQRSLHVYETQRLEAERRKGFAEAKAEEVATERAKVHEQLLTTRREVSEGRRRAEFMKCTLERLARAKMEADVGQNWRASTLLGSKADQIIMALDTHPVLGRINPFAFVCHQLTGSSPAAIEKDRDVGRLRSQILQEAVKSAKDDNIYGLCLPSWKLTFGAFAGRVALINIQIRSMLCNYSPAPPINMSSPEMLEVESLRRLLSVFGSSAQWTVSRYLEAGGQPGTSLAAFAWLCLGNVRRIVEEVQALRREFLIFKSEYLRFSPPEAGESSKDACFSVHIFAEGGDVQFVIRFLLDDTSSGLKSLTHTTTQIDIQRALKHGSLAASAVSMELHEFSPGLPLLAKVAAADLQAYRKRVKSLSELARVMVSKVVNP